jgi:hypothetical protein
LALRLWLHPLASLPFHQAMCPQTNLRWSLYQSSVTAAHDAQSQLNNLEYPHPQHQCKRLRFTAIFAYHPGDTGLVCGLQTLRIVVSIAASYRFSAFVTLGSVAAVNMQ